MSYSHAVSYLLLAILVVGDRSARGFQLCAPCRWGIRRRTEASAWRRSQPRHLGVEPSEENHSISAPTKKTASQSSPLSSSVESSSSSLSLLEPDSPASRHLMVDALGLSETQFGQLVQLSHLICEWNDKINLVSRKDCTPSRVWTRHIVPSVAAYGMKGGTTENPLVTAQTVVDVGTGGGFPGLPLAIAYPDAHFVLLDSVGKKLIAVRDVAQRLGLNNVETHHGRAEDYRPPKGRRFDVATGRSVSNVPQFCSWMHHLVNGHLLYWIGDSTASGGEETGAGHGGGEVIPASVVAECTHIAIVESLLQQAVSTDKRILVIERDGVRRLARQQPFDKASGAAAVRSTRPPRRQGATGNNEPQRRPRRPQVDAPSRSTAPTFRAASRDTWQRPVRTPHDPDGASFDRFRRYDSRDAPQ